jgi:hypothetical protein
MGKFGPESWELQRSSWLTLPPVESPTRNTTKIENVTQSNLKTGIQTRVTAILWDRDSMDYRWRNFVLRSVHSHTAYR